jgi:chromosome segregation ATPase
MNKPSANGRLAEARPGGEGMNKTREQWAGVDAQLCAKQNSVAANWYLIRDAQQDIAKLYTEVDRLTAENERLGLKADSLEFAKWSCQMNQQAIQAAGHETIDDLAAERDELTAELQRQHESHRTTWTQLEQAKAVLTDLMESAEYWGEYDVPVGIVDRMRAVLEMSQ